ncbi:FRG domain-containing protein [Kocuria flava]|uniref:FRG domain-containing protein n=1 Tax=Kocuria flava TaxID=446860 RepID=UPI001FF2BDE9|nr:FRG domain-containing protein [Kocuria flava]MCJ8506090.1 FRG domain-containing protein [Kocuria flava]
MKPPAFDNWLAHGWGIQVSTTHQVLKIISRIALLANDRTYAWRGQNDSTYLFNSSLYRRLAAQGDDVTEEVMRKEELEVLEEARRWGLGRDLGASATDLHLLAVLQHHGVPTRLIDVTSDPMTALWFATEEHRPDEKGNIKRSPGVLFAVDVTQTHWYETFQHSGAKTYATAGDPIAGPYKQALKESQSSNGAFFRVFPALPDERMKAQQGFLLGSTVPKKHNAPGVLGLNPIGPGPGEEKLKKLLNTEAGPGRPVNLPFCAIVIPPDVKDKLRDPLKRTYNRRRRVLFPDVDGFRDAFLRKQLD